MANSFSAFSYRRIRCPYRLRSFSIEPTNVNDDATIPGTAALNVGVSTNCAKESSNCEGIDLSCFGPSRG